MVRVAEEITVAKEPVSTFASIIHFIPVDGFSSTNGTRICAHGAGDDTVMALLFFNSSADNDGLGDVGIHPTNPAD